MTARELITTVLNRVPMTYKPGQIVHILRYQIVQGITIVGYDRAEVIAVHDNPYKLADNEPSKTVFVWGMDSQWGMDCVSRAGQLIAYDVWYHKYRGSNR